MINVYTSDKLITHRCAVCGGGPLEAEGKRLKCPKCQMNYILGGGELWEIGVIKR